MRPEAVENRLRSLSELAAASKRINGRHRLLATPMTWERAYEAIAPNKGALTAGVDPHNTLDGFSPEKLSEVIKAVMNGTYRFKPSCSMPQKPGDMVCATICCSS